MPGFHKNTVYGWLAKAREGKQFPAIRTEAKKLGATAYFTDEAGIRSDYHAGTTWHRA